MVLLAFHAGSGDAVVRENAHGSGTALTTYLHDVDDLRGVARRLVREIVHARYTVLPGVGHIVNMEAPERFSEIVLDFLDSLAARVCDDDSPSACAAVRQ